MTKIQGFAVAGKAWTALAGSLLTFLVPWVVEQSANLPAPWPSLIAAAVALATAVGVYHAPYQPVSKPPVTGGDNPWPQ